MSEPLFKAKASPKMERARSTDSGVGGRSLNLPRTASLTGLGQPAALASPLQVSTADTSKRERSPDRSQPPDAVDRQVVTDDERLNGFQGLSKRRALSSDIDRRRSSAQEDQPASPAATEPPFPGLSALPRAPSHLSAPSRQPSPFGLGLHLPTYASPPLKTAKAVGFSGLGLDASDDEAEDELMETSRPSNHGGFSLHASHDEYDDDDALFEETLRRSRYETQAGPWEPDYEDDEDEEKFGGFGFPSDDVAEHKGPALETKEGRGEAAELASSPAPSSAIPRTSATAATAAKPEGLNARPKRGIEFKPSAGTGTETQTAIIERIAKELGIPIEHQAQHGTHLTSARHLAEMPRKLNFAGFRARQVLHHHSEILKWHLSRTVDPAATRQAQEKADKAIRTQTKGRTQQARKVADVHYDPTEVQTQYVARGGKLHVSVSANQPDSARYLSSMTAEQLRQVYREAAESTDPVAQKAAFKILNIDAQNQRRRAQPSAVRERETDLDRAAALAGLVTDRGAQTVVVNKYERHAEQNLRRDYLTQKTYAHGVDLSKDEVDVAGTLIRCGSCSQEVGPDELLTRVIRAHFEEQAAKAKAENRQFQMPTLTNISGIIYLAQIAPENIRPMLEAYDRGRSMERNSKKSNASKRAASSSPVADRTRPAAPPSVHSGSQLGLPQPSAPTSPLTTAPSQPMKQASLHTFFKAKAPTTPNNGSSQ